MIDLVNEQTIEKKSEKVGEQKREDLDEQVREERGRPVEERADEVANQQSTINAVFFPDYRWAFLCHCDYKKKSIKRLRFVPA